MWGVLPLVSSYVKCQTAGGQPEQSWPSGPHLGRVCTHMNWGGGQQRILVCVLGQGHSQAVTICCPVKRPGQGLAPLRSKPSTFPGLVGFAELLVIIGPSFSVPTNRDSALLSYGGWGQDSPKVVTVVKSSVTQPMLPALLPAPALVLVALLRITVTESPGPARAPTANLSSLISSYPLLQEAFSAGSPLKSLQSPTSRGIQPTLSCSGCLSHAGSLVDSSAPTFRPSLVTETYTAMWYPRSTT